MDRERERKKNNMVWMLVQIMEIASLLSEAQFGNALEVTKYKIIYLSVPS